MDRAREIHVWRLRLEVPGAIVARFERLLAPDEMERAGRFQFEHLRRRFVIARAALRLLLSRYLHVPAEQILFTYGPKGKPRVTGASIHFNTSHSGDLALLAFAGCEIGVDIEQIRPLPELEEIAKRFFCAQEAAELTSLPLSERERAFFRCWTRKEAYLKAVGDGLSAPLDGFQVSLRPNEPARFIHIGGDWTECGAWTLHDLSAGSQYAAALAYRAARRTVQPMPESNPGELLES